MNIVSVGSPHFSQGRKTYKPEAIVIHVMEGSLTGTDGWFRDPRSSVSAHYGVGKGGEVHAYVLEKDTAWHAGRVNAPVWPLIKSAGRNQYINPNYYTIGIEHEGTGLTDWTPEMYNASAALIKEICTRWNIPLDRNHIIGHRDIYSLKTCPGPKADINRLIALAGGTTEAATVVVPAGFVKTEEKGKVTTTARVNLRSQPGTALPPVRSVAPNIQLAYDGFTNDGEKINNNGKWYYTNEGAWFWSGAVTAVPEVPIRIIEAPRVIGGLTLAQIKGATGATTENATKFQPYIADTCQKFNINTPVRQLCFLAQVGHESGQLIYTEELASGKAYENRKDLGNVYPGDGVKYKGRGLIQITGRFNYKEISDVLGEDFIAHPEKLGGKSTKDCTPEQLKNAVLSAGWFWNKKKLNAIADEIDIHLPIDAGNNLIQYKLITKKINGKYNGLADRLVKYRNGVPFFV